MGLDRVVRFLAWFQEKRQISDARALWKKANRAVTHISIQRVFAGGPFRFYKQNLFWKIGQIRRGFADGQRDI